MNAFIIYRNEMSVSLPVYFGWPTAAAALLIVIDHFLLNIITLH